MILKTSRHIIILFNFRVQYVAQTLTTRKAEKVAHLLFFAYRNKKYKQNKIETFQLCDTHQWPSQYLGASHDNS